MPPSITARSRIRPSLGLARGKLTGPQLGLQKMYRNEVGERRLASQRRSQSPLTASVRLT